MTTALPDTWFPPCDTVDLSRTSTTDSLGSLVSIAKILTREAQQVVLTFLQDTFSMLSTSAASYISSSLGELESHCSSVLSQQDISQVHSETADSAHDVLQVRRSRCIAHVTQLNGFRSSL